MRKYVITGDKVWSMSQKQSLPKICRDGAALEIEMVEFIVENRKPIETEEEHESHGGGTESAVR